jgi:hypothetical protein
VSDVKIDCATDIARALGEVESLDEECLPLLSRQTDAPTFLEEEAPAGLEPEFVTFARRLELIGEREYSLQVGKRLEGITVTHPLRRAPVPLGGYETLIGLLPVMGQKCRVLIELVGEDLLYRTGDERVRAAAAVLEL